ncbi:MAG: hypothetical protein E7342_01435 [Clostridiales bacterium]|nr:hypothetical protein [Clostridiales bacterium]
MKKVTTKKELVRLKNIIEGDRFLVKEDYVDLVVSDLYELLKDYFELKEVPVLTILRERDSYKITVTANANRIKSFGVLPKD